MKIVKILKNCRGGGITHYLVFHKEVTDEEINSNAEEWCETDPNGSSYGYSWEWSFVDDEKEINDVLLKEIKSINMKIKYLEERGFELAKYLK